MSKLFYFQLKSKILQYKSLLRMKDLKSEFPQAQKQAVNKQKQTIENSCYKFLDF